MISNATISTVRLLLKEGNLSRRKIALQLGISRGMIHKIEVEFTDEERSAEESSFRFPQGPHRRCLRCGARVQLPCLACQLRDQMKTQPSVSRLALQDTEH
jgi:hypothetical protein